jgi:hypothetical protein
MPVFLEPDQTFDVCLDVDANKPVETRPTFFAKSQTMRGQLKILEVVDRLFSENPPPPEDLFAETCDMLLSVLYGWKNMGGFEFSRESLYDVLQYTEARELLRKIAYNQKMSPEQKKSSE